MGQTLISHIIDSNTSPRCIGKIARDLHSSARKQRPTADHLIIFLHGYNNSAKDINRRTELIHNKLGSKYVITTAFNWKSVNSFYGYKSDQNCAEQCAKHFVDYLAKIRYTQFTKIDIVAHSMGNFLLVKAINFCKENNKLNVFKRCNIISLAADVAYFEYLTATLTASLFVSSWTHYYNLLDPALALSNKAQLTNYIPFQGEIGSHFAGRAGQSSTGNDFVKSIRWVSAWNGHGYIDDVFAPNAVLAPHIIQRREREDAARARKDIIWFICELFMDIIVVCILFIVMIWYLGYIDLNQLDVKHQGDIYWEDVLNALYFLLKVMEMVADYTGSGSIHIDG